LTQKKNDLLFIVLTLVVYFVAGSLFSFWYSHNTEASLLYDVDQRLNKVTAEIPHLVEPDFPDRLISGARINAYERDENTLALRRFSEREDIEQLFTVVLNNGRIQLVAANWSTKAGSLARVPLSEYDYINALASGKPLRQTFERPEQTLRLYGKVFSTADGTRYLACATSDVSYISTLINAKQRESFVIILIFTLLPLALTLLHRRTYRIYSHKLDTELKRHRSAEESYRDNDALLRSVSRATQHLFNPDDWNQELINAIKLLGEALNLSRVQVYKNHGSFEAGLRFTHRCEWVAPGNKAIEFPSPGGLRYEGLGLNKVSAQLRRGESVVIARPDERNEEEQVLLQRYGISAIILVPVMTAGHWWGFITFEDCAGPRDWNETEIFALQTAVSALSAAIERKHSEEAIKLNEARLETLLNLNLMNTASLREIVQFTLWQQVKLTGSEFGYIAIMDNQEEIRAIHFMANNQIRQLDKASIAAWGEQSPWRAVLKRHAPIIANDQLEAPLKWLQECDVPIMRQANVPLFEAGGIVVVAGVANSATRYKEADFNQLTLLIQGMWRLLQRRQAEAEHLRLVTAVEQAAETIVITDSKGVILYCNPAFTKLNGYSIDEVLGKLAQSFVIREDQEDLLDEILGEIAENDFWQGRTLNRRHDGSTFPVENTVSPVRDTGGRLVNYVAVQRDVSHEVELETQLRQAQKLEAIGTLAGGIAHDFNNILGAILGYTELAMHDLDQDSRGHQRLREVYRAGMRASELVKQILTFSRQGEHERKPVQLQPVIGEAVKLLRGTIPATIEIITAIDERCGLVMADTTRIHQVVMNLCTNAYHAMPDGGLLEIVLNECSITEADGLIGLKPGRHICLSVRDSGIGMSSKTIERIFEPYFTTKAPGQGTGLGLASVHGIVTSHEGAIKVQSAPGAGSTFEVFLPLIAGLSARAAESGLMPELPHGSASVLFVDDEEALVELEQTVLEDLGYRVSAFSSSTDALLAFRANPEHYDVIITDQTMPRLTGLELAQAMLQIRPELPIILCSGFSESIDSERLAACGIRVFLPKPVITARLAQTLHDVLNADARPANAAG